ncbi:thioredoxin [Algivirga pacifica]|uniref:Thioredoxin n=1 Tax=Algivirga pacifica TaxID=1162670 RepID=A0ABP9D5V7_9BACT
MAKFTQLINKSDAPVLVDFYADWCQPCHALAPIIRDVSKEYGEKLKVVKVNIDKNQQAALKYQVRSIPTLILFHKGKLLWRAAGVQGKQQLMQVIDRHVQ